MKTKKQVESRVAFDKISMKKGRPVMMMTNGTPHFYMLALCLWQLE
jgi:hypothetical protein